jgi:hypothetical protein
VCSISKRSELADLICEAGLIWDEAPMQHSQAVDHTFQDVRDCDKPFGGFTFVFGGDIQQMLPVITGASMGQTVSACIQKSALWRSIVVLHLHQNMWLNTSIEAKRAFAEWQLEVGQGKHTDEGGIISLPDHIKCRVNSIDSLIDTIYPVS